MCLFHVSNSRSKNDLQLNLPDFRDENGVYETNDARTHRSHMLGSATRKSTGLLYHSGDDGCGMLFDISIEKKFLLQLLDGMSQEKTL